MAGLKIKFQPLFIIYVFMCVYFGWFNLIFYYVVAVVLHECGHYFVAKYYGYNVDKIIFRLYGAGLNSNNSYKPKHDIVISLAGPCVNLILIILTVFFWWVFPTTYYFTYDFMICNLIVMCFNLIPIYPLDGGRVVFALFSKRFKSKKILLKINRYLCFCLGLLFLTLFLISIFTTINYSLLFIGLFLSFNGIIDDNSVYHEKARIYAKQSKSVIEVKTFKVASLDKTSMLRYISPHYYSIFEYYDGNNVVTITEEELLNLDY